MTAPEPRPGTQRCVSCRRPRPLSALWLVEGVGDEPTYVCRDRDGCRDKLRARALGQVQLSFPPGWATGLTRPILELVAAIRERAPDLHVTEQAIAALAAELDDQEAFTPATVAEFVDVWEGDQRRHRGAFQLVYDPNGRPMLVPDPAGRLNNLETLLPAFRAATADWTAAAIARASEAARQREQVSLERIAPRLAVSLRTLMRYRRQFPIVAASAEVPKKAPRRHGAERKSA